MRLEEEIGIHAEKDIEAIFRYQQEKFRERKLAGISPSPSSNMARPSWEIMHSTDLEEIISKAIELGWAENKVQVRRYFMTPTRFHYYIEPFEEDCHCPSLLKYEDFAPNPSVIEG